MEGWAGGASTLSCRFERYTRPRMGLLIFRREGKRGFEFHLPLKSCSTELGPLADMAINSEISGLDAKIIIFLEFQDRAKDQGTSV